MGLKLWIVENNLGLEFLKMDRSLFNNIYYCGYAKIDRYILSNPSQSDNIIDRIEVHGGITYSHQEKDGSATYGFDCNHGFDCDDNAPSKDISYVQDQCEIMARWLIVALKYDKLYYDAPSVLIKNIIVDRMYREMDSLSG